MLLTSGCWRLWSGARTIQVAGGSALAVDRDAFRPVWLGVVLVYGLLALYVERDQLSPGLTFRDALRRHRQRPRRSGRALHVRTPLSSRAVLLRFADRARHRGLLIRVLIFRPLADRRTVAAGGPGARQPLVRRYGWDTLVLVLPARRQGACSSRPTARPSSPTPTSAARPGLGRPDRRAESSIPLVIDEFLAFCAARGWRTAFLAVRESDLPLYEARGMQGPLPR